ncbi:hypothetical protein J6590_052563 [Homalodisca vitripennis]|nr:hypothetical protein J6590_052563 [Homalodisca vitripennis]
MVSNRKIHPPSLARTLAEPGGRWAVRSWTGEGESPPPPQWVLSGMNMRVWRQAGSMAATVPRDKMVGGSFVSPLRREFEPRWDPRPVHPGPGFLPPATDLDYCSAAGRAALTVRSSLR